MIWLMPTSQTSSQADAHVSDSSFSDSSSTLLQLGGISYKHSLNHSFRQPGIYRVPHWCQVWYYVFGCEQGEYLCPRDPSRGSSSCFRLFSYTAPSASTASSNIHTLLPSTTNPSSSLRSKLNITSSLKLSWGCQAPLGLLLQIPGVLTLPSLHILFPLLDQRLHENENQTSGVHQCLARCLAHVMISIQKNERAQAFPLGVLF